MTIRPAAPPAPPSAGALARPDAGRTAPERPEPAAPAARPAPAGPLSSAERRALDEQFPAAPDLALRLYGPRSGSAPAPALGGRLDLRG